MQDHPDQAGAHPLAAGDPAGRRLSRRRAQQLAEAGRVARLLEVQLQRAAFDTTGLTQLTAAIAHEERVLLERSYGRIEPRRRLKGGSSQPLIDRRARRLLFIDEAGQSFPDPAVSQQVFALAGVAITAAEALRYRRQADRLKQRFFRRSDVTFHEPMMRNHEGPFYFDGDADRQQTFLAAVDELVRGTDFVAFGAAVRKDAFADFGATGVDPYLPTDVYAVAIQMLLERYVDYLALSAPDKPLGRVIFESQGALEDAQHERDFVGVLLDGTQWIAGNSFRQWLETGVRFSPKQASGPLELADMLARDLYEWVRAGCTTWPGRWRSFSDRIYCRDERRMGTFGVKVFPDHDIRDRIEDHRRQTGRQEN